LHSVISSAERDRRHRRHEAADRQLLRHFAWAFHLRSASARKRKVFIAIAYRSRNNASLFPHHGLRHIAKNGRIS
jgi:hypothetical protein